MISTGIASALSLGVVAAILLRVARRGLFRPFSFRRAQMSMLSPFGANVASVIAIVEIVQIGVALGALSSPSRDWAGAFASALIAVLAVAAVGLAITPAHARDLIGMLAVAAAIVETYLSHGIGAVVAVIAILLPALWILGLARGFLGR